MPNPIMIMILLPLIGCLFAMMTAKNRQNAFNVAIFTLISNILVMLRLFSLIDLTQSTSQLRQSYEWISDFGIRLTFSVDAFSLILLLGIYIALITALVGLCKEDKNNKSLMLLTLCFIWNITGFFAAGDIISFYVFFAGMLLPLFMLVGIFSYSQKISLYRFFMYNFIGITALLPAVIILCKFFEGNVLLSEITFVTMNKRIGMIVWFAVCLSFISRIPVWPFHYWISSVTSSIKNPLVYIIVNIMPLIGIYGFVRFWPLSVPESVEILVPIIETFAIITMIFVALIAFANQQFLYKIFSYTTIYYLLFLLAVILPTDILKMNIAYSSFIFLIVTASLIILDYDLWEKCKKENCEYGNILPHTPKLAATFAFFALIAMGLPISSLFWSNFVLVSEIFVQNFIVGVMVMTALTMAAIVLMDELLKMFSTPETYSNKFEVSDISRSKFAYLISVITILLLSFFNPLWFVF